MLWMQGHPSPQKSEEEEKPSHGYDEAKDEVVEVVEEEEIEMVGYLDCWFIDREVAKMHLRKVLIHNDWIM